MTVCPQCGYERTNDDDSFVSPAECPKCGIFYQKWKPSSVSKSDEPIAFIGNKRHSSKKEMLKGACYLSAYCIVVSPLVNVIRIYFGTGDDSIAPFIGWLFLMGLAILLSLVAALSGLASGIFEIFKLGSGNPENKQEESTALTVLSILSCFVPISVLLLFYYIHLFLHK